ncbi:endo-1,4-beta-xylanase [Polaribacter undariae]|uniref:Beta-xylanase n=1 Tax=Polaribacter sejongensis TaxID=985043 RepID=A0AAJ1VH77_9FLAO|nr:MULTISPECIES: endo-1,4-beta-xylanase [Polaribacter]MDN3620533.1 endo-1,4-beta-xylanase [Polaribacter undariae]UWD31263.1 endo-1,4-beta-xylanase [Polaribacter undariae]
MKTKNLIKLAYILVIFTSVIACNNSKEKKEVIGLKNAATFPIGTAININRLLNDAKLQKLQIENFNSITATSDMKMQSILPVENQYNWKTSDTILQYATKHNQRLFGHNLIWHSSTPKWVEEKGEKDSIWLGNFMQEYIKTYVGRYKGKVAAWDVVNEAFESSGANYRESFWYKKLGKSYIEKAFQYAHEADPEAILFYNDFNIERDTVKLNAVLKMVNEFKAKGVPISGIGFQMHIRMDIPDEIIAYALKKAAETGLQIHLSEVDIIFNTHNDERLGGIQNYSVLTDEMKQAQAEKYKNLIKMYKEIVPREQQFGITFWDFTDRDSWIKGFFNLKDWPCIYDDNLQPKPAYFGVLDGLKE